MRKIDLATALLLCCSAILLHAQPQPCGPNPAMTPFCDEACIICDINGFTGINDAGVTGQAPPGFCTGTVHHMQWIGFIAGSTDLTLNVKPTNCQNGNGLEIGIYHSLDCENFQLVSNCDGDVLQNETGVFSNTVPLVIGQYYYLVMDGNHDDVCHYTVTVVNGSTAVAALPTSGVLDGDLTVCPGRTADYTLSPPSGATWFSWTLDGVPVKSSIDTTVTLNWTIPGLHEVCAIASNVCDTAPPTCRLVNVQPIPPTYLATNICTGDCWQGADTTICDPGQYTFHFAGMEGCDSVVYVQVNQYPTDITTLDLMICKGDTLQIGNKPFYETGQFQEILSNRNGCDSTVNLALQVIVCEIKGSLDPEPVNCYGQPNGALHFRVNDGTPPLNYVWQRIGSAQPAGSGTISTVNKDIDITNLPEGTYFITVTDNFGHDLVLFGNVSEPLPLDASLEHADFSGYQVSCAGGADGWLKIVATGGKQPYQYHWNNNGLAAQATNLSAGTYTCTITDNGGCTAVFSETLTEPPALAFQAAFTDPGCAGLNSGAAMVTAASGGVLPYSYKISGGDFSTATTFDSLWYGAQTLSIRDANGCIQDTTVALPKPLIPHIEVSPDITVELAESAPLYLISNVPLDSILWMPAIGLSCTNCPKPDATPYTTTTYSVKVFSANNKCIDEDSLTVSVLDKRDVYIPNSFSPNDDGKNDRFTVFGGPEVLRVQTLEIWSRWGELVFQGKNFQPNEERYGWDGFARGKALPPGVFTWRADLEFVDGLVLHYKGDVTVVR